tara:strand:- start:28737 stop:32843 length:4107 start_codon:yes stop_codon:yes gene_type:complete
MLGNLNILTITYVIAGLSALYSHSIFAEPAATDTPKLNELKTRYNLDSPTRNHQSDVLPPKVEAQIASPGASRDMMPIITNTLSTPSTPRTIDLSGYLDPSSPETFDEHRDLAVNLSQTHGSPSGAIESTASGDSIGSVNLEYARSGTRQFVRDADGKLVMKVIEGVDRVSGANANDLFSNEHDAGHPGYDFETGKQTLYGNEEGIFDEGKAAHNNFKDPVTGRTSAGRGYRAVTDGAYRAVQTPSPLGMLEQSFNHLESTQDPTLWLSRCTTETIPSSATFTSTSSTEHFCQDTGQANFDFCEVERDIKIPVYSSTPGLRSCGTGCYEFDLNIQVPSKKWSCRRTESGHGTPAEFVFNLIMAEPLVISSVTITGKAQDHFRYQLNGQSLWQNTGGSQNFTGDYLSGSCNRSGHTISQDVTSRVNSIIGPLPATGTVPLSFRADLRWRGGGNLTSVVKIQLATSDGSSLESEFIQYPEGCYDALTMEDKLTRGLDGVYDWAELGIDPSLPPIRYQCESSPRLPLCEAGELPFGSAGFEKCYAEPDPPVCASGTFNSDSQRCEYPATINCPVLSGVACGSDPATGAPRYPVGPVHEIVDDTCIYSDAEHCGSWSYELPVNKSCPSGGTLEGNLCVSEADISNICDTDSGYGYTTIIIEGVEYQRCERPVQNYSDHIWSCDSVNGEPQSFSTSYCNVLYEEFVDQDGNPIRTIDDEGFPIPPPYLDEEGVPFEFKDIASCIKPQPLPDVEPVELPSSFCTFDEYESIEIGSRGYPEAVLSEIPPFFLGDEENKTWKVNLAGYRCDPTQGRIMCFPDPDTGEEQCYDWEDLKNLPDRCARYKEDDRCSEIDRDCTEGWLEPISGRCMAETVTYRCDDETVIDYETEIERNTCESMIPCVGGDCEVGGLEQNDKFVEAMVAGSILDNIQGDSSCKDPNDPTTCRIFEGEYKYCSWETSGLGTDCCEEAQGVDILGYVTFTRQMLKVNQMAYTGAFGEGISGGYQQLAQPITDGYRAVADWASSGIRSASESIFGNAAATTTTNTGTISALTDGISAALSAVQQQVYQFVYDMLPDALANMVFETTATAAGTELVMNEAIGNLLSNVMAVYAAYQMIKLALTLLTACDEYEMDMGVKLAQRQCFKVGPRYCNKSYFGTACMQRRQDYCCYSSILARIVMKEAYDQLSINPLPFGTKLSAESDEANASCLGLDPEQLSMLDFNAPSMQTALQEWIGLLLEAGEIPTESSEQSLTGGATSVDASCPPQQKPVLTCYVDPVTLEEICEHARDALGNLLYEDVPTECIKELTPGQIWNAGDRKSATERITGPEGYIHGSQDRVLEGKEQIKTLINELDCSIVPRPPVCLYGFNPIED